VGVEVVEFLDGYSDGVVEYGLGLRRDLARAVRGHRPEVVVGLTAAERFAGGGSNQADHRAVGLATLDAAKDAGNRWIFRELLDEGLEPWSGVRYVCFSGAPEPTHGVDVTGYLDAGVASLRAHRAYLEGLGDSAPDPAEMLPWMASGSGPRLGVDEAVLFDVHVLIGDEELPWD
jgi:LmbE family N-acetylglucosaminyl deacetylase